MEALSDSDDEIQLLSSEVSLMNSKSKGELYVSLSTREFGSLSSAQGCFDLSAVAVMTAGEDRIHLVCLDPAGTARLYTSPGQPSMVHNRAAPTENNIYEAGYTVEVLATSKLSVVHFALEGEIDDKMGNRITWRSAPFDIDLSRLPKPWKLPPTYGRLIINS